MNYIKSKQFCFIGQSIELDEGEESILISDEYILRKANNYEIDVIKKQLLGCFIDHQKDISIYMSVIVLMSKMGYQVLK